MVDREKVTGFLGSFSRTTRDSYERVLDHTAAMQERNVRFAQEMVEGSINELREQAESNRAMALDLAERADKQRDALQKVVEESLGAYMDLAFAPLSYYKEGLTLAGKATT
jgi:cbb3-type cytochrome oxidase cytochrome c subunit